MKVLGKDSYSLEEYVSDANWIIKNGTYIAERNGYCYFIGNAGKGGNALFVFWGLKNNGTNTYKIG